MIHEVSMQLLWSQSAVDHGGRDLNAEPGRGPQDRGKKLLQAPCIVIFIHGDISRLTRYAGIRYLEGLIPNLKSTKSQLSLPNNLSSLLEGVVENSVCPTFI